MELTVGITGASGTIYAHRTLRLLFAEFFKDVLKGLLDSRVKKLYFCMRNHNYSGSGKSGFIKVASSPMIRQYIALTRLYKLEIILVDIFPDCNCQVMNRR